MVSIRLANSFNCTLIVALDDIFYHPFSDFFSLLLRSVHVYTGRNTVRVRICMERDTVRIHHNPIPSRVPIVTLLLFELTSRDFAVIYCFRHASNSDQGPERAQHWQKRTASFRRRKYPLFRCLFPRRLLLRFSCPCRS